MKTFFANAIQTYVGVAIPSGSTCILTLSQDAVSLVGNVIAQTRYVIPIDATGSFSLPIWFTDELNPSNIGYRVQIQVPNVGIVYDQKNVPIIGASFNLASYVPGSAGLASGVVLPVFETNGTKNAVQSLLNLIAGTDITLTADSLGDVTIAAAGSNAGTANQIAYYAATGTAVSGNPRLTDSGTELTYIGTTGINIPSTGGYIFNNDTVMSRLSANIIGFGNGVGQTNGTIEAAEFYSPGGSVYTGGGGGVTTSSLSVLGATATFGTAGTTSGVITLEGSTSGSATITAPAVAGTATNPFEFSNGIDFPSGTGISWNNDVCISRLSGGRLAIGSSPGLTNGVLTTQYLLANVYVQAGEVGATGQLLLVGGTSGYATITGPAVAGMPANPFEFTNGIDIASGTSFSMNDDTFISRGGAGVFYFGSSQGSANGAYLYSNFIIGSGIIQAYALTVGVAGTTGIITMEGGTSGSCTISAPAIAGTVANAIVFSNSIATNGGLTVGVAGTLSGVITLEGSTSGSCTITAPATAGTATNPIVFSNAIQTPSGTAAAPAHNFSASASTGMYLLSAVGSPPSSGIGFSVNGVLQLAVEDNGIAITGHFNTNVANSDSCGQISSVSGTTVSKVFASTYTSTPVVVVTPTTNAGAFYLSAVSKTGFTVTYATSGAQTFNYDVTGNPN